MAIEALESEQYCSWANRQSLVTTVSAQYSAKSFMTRALNESWRHMKNESSVHDAGGGGGGVVTSQIRLAKAVMVACVCWHDMWMHAATLVYSAQSAEDILPV